MTEISDTAKQAFRLEEVTIDDLHAAIRTGQTTCVEVVQGYIDRARAYNGVASVLVTEDGAPATEANGTVRAGAPLKFPVQRFLIKKPRLLPTQWVTGRRVETTFAHHQISCSE